MRLNKIAPIQCTADAGPRRVIIMTAEYSEIVVWPVIATSLLYWTQIVKHLPYLSLFLSHTQQLRLPFGQIFDRVWPTFCSVS